jgi:hypothetical protein
MAIFGDAIQAVTKGAFGALSALQSATVSGGDYTFPKDLNSEYYLMFNFCKYTREDLNSVGSAPTIAKVRLPVPTSLTDNYGVNYSEEALGTGVGASLNAAAGGDMSGLAGTVAASTLAAGIEGNSPIGKAAIASGEQVASAMSGIALNPFLTIMFKSPQYKEYTFSWRLFPKNNTEAITIRNIATLIRYHMLPDRSSGFGGAILTWPSLVRCQIVAKGNELYQFKYGVIKDFHVNYAPDGTPSFYKDGQPTAVEMSLHIQEVEYFIKSNTGSSV